MQGLGGLWRNETLGRINWPGRSHLTHLAPSRAHWKARLKSHGVFIDSLEMLGQNNPIGLGVLGAFGNVEGGPLGCSVFVGSLEILGVALLPKPDRNGATSGITR